MILESLALDTVETPAAVVERSVMSANASRFAAYCDRHGLAWRPHIKTHKSTRVARLQLAAGAQGLTVATPHEAEVMARVCTDLLLAYPPVGSRKIERLMALPDEVRLSVAVDSLDVLRPLAAAARATGRSLDILIEVDVGLRRVGVQGVEAALRLAEGVAGSDGVRYRGVLFYAGHLRGPRDEIADGLARLSADVSGLRDALEREGLPPAVVSGGTTPTLWQSHTIEGLTEVRAGTCIFFDRDGLAVGVAEPDDFAYTVLATVISTAVAGQAAIDAGSKALAAELRGDLTGYGAVLGRPEVEVVRLSEEHGVLDLSHTDWRPVVGERVRIVPNHVCVSVNLQDRLLVADDGAVEAWPIEARGRLGGAR